MGKKEHEFLVLNIKILGTKLVWYSTKTIQIWYGGIMVYGEYQGTFDTRLVWYLEMCPISPSPLQTNVGKFSLFETWS